MPPRRPDKVAFMNPEEQIATILDPVLREHLDDVARAALVDEFLDDLAVRGPVAGRDLRPCPASAEAGPH